MAGKTEFAPDLSARICGKGRAKSCARKWIVLAFFAARADYLAATNAPALQVAVVGVKMGFALSSIAVISLPLTVTG